MNPQSVSQPINDRLDYGHTIEFGIVLDPDAGNPRGVLETARNVDRLGYDLIAIPDHPYNAASLDTSSLLATILAQTASVRVFADVANLPLRPPAMLAKAAASLDLLSGGRFELGIGSGVVLDAAHAMGAPALTPGQSLSALQEAVAIMRAMWSGQRRGLRFDGRHYQLAGVHPGPAPAHPIGIWIGALRPQALALTGRVADGWVAPVMTAMPPHAAEQGNLAIDRAARIAGRDPRQIRRLYNIPGKITPTSPGPATDNDQAIVGPPEHWADVLTHLALDIGISTFILAVPPDPQTLTTLIEQVAPKVRQRVAKQRAAEPTTAGETYR
jgi:alkanesulfonate monooxygenase SsuD/methylene tetrahydromethanopterin reductase-like flavin-dependent oxidoreductase (luciferase family)